MTKRKTLTSIYSKEEKKIIENKKEKIIIK